MSDQLAHKSALLARARRVVVKVGSAILSNRDGIDSTRLNRLVDELCTLRARHQVVLVSSGAVAVGMARLGHRERPRTVPQRQAAAAAIEAAAIHCLEHGPTTPDLGGTATTDEVGSAIAELLAKGNA